MRNKKPPFEITNQMIDQVAEIAELVGKISSAFSLSSNPTLRRSNRIRTIHGSLAIEQNTLSLEQVTAVLNGKHVLAPPKDIAEVKNAYEIYERLDKLDPYSVDDLLTAHNIMTVSYTHLIPVRQAVQMPRSSLPKADSSFRPLSLLHSRPEQRKPRAAYRRRCAPYPHGPSYCPPGWPQAGARILPIP